MKIVCHIDDIVLRDSLIWPYNSNKKFTITMTYHYLGYFLDWEALEIPI